ncbi:MAG: glycosyltransferase family 4 protein [Thermoanaerobaculia bacterium]
MRVGIDCRKIADYGIGTYIRGLLGGFAATDVDATFVLYVPTDLGDLVPRDARFEIVTDDSPNYSVRELFALQRQIDRSKVDLFHAPHYVTPMTTVPLVVTVHDLIHILFPESTPNLFAPYYANWMIGRSVTRARRVLTVSDTVRRSIVERWPGTADRIVITPNGVDARFFERVDPGRAAEILRACGLERGRYFLYVGNDKQHKNIETLLAAFLEEGDALAPFQLAFAGRDFPNVPELPRVVKTGYVDDESLRALYQNALALVIPSSYEGFGLPAIEAMASGTPVIASTGGALPEVTGDAAIHVSPASRVQLREALVRIASDHALRAQLIERGLRRASSFSWSSTATTTLDAYRASMRG